MSSMVQVNRVCLKILLINRPQFLVDSNELRYSNTKIDIKTESAKQSGKMHRLVMHFATQYQ